MIEIDVARHSHLIDPQLHVWGWEIPVYLFLGGMAAGVMILSALLGTREGERSAAARWLPFLAPVLVSVGMVALFLDLSHKLYVWRFYLAFRWSSPMSWGAWILLVVYPVTILQGLASLDDAQAAWLAGKLGRLGGRAAALRSWALPRAQGIRTAAMLTGAGLGVYTGILLSTLGARPLWGSALLGPLRPKRRKAPRRCPRSLVPLRLTSPSRYQLPASRRFPIPQPVPPIHPRASPRFPIPLPASPRCPSLPPARSPRAMPSRLAP